MKAIILNPGIESRLNITCAVLGNGETIFERQIRILSECGIYDFVVVTGPFQKQLEDICCKKEFCHLRFKFINNLVIDSSSDADLYSLNLSREYIDDALVLNGNLVFNKRLIEDLLKSDNTSLALVNKSDNTEKECFKVRVFADMVQEVSKDIFGSNCFNLQPLYKLSKSNLGIWVKKSKLFLEGKNSESLVQDILDEVLKKEKVFYCEKYFIDEINNLSDLENISKQIRQYDLDDQLIISNPGEYINIPNLLARSNAKKPLLVCDHNFDKLFISNYFKSLSFEIVKFSTTGSLPDYEEIVKGVEVFKGKACDFIISVGGDDTINSAKLIKLFSVLDQNKNYLDQELLYSPIKHLAIPTTAEQGGESTSFSTLISNGERHVVAHDCILPEYVILEPKFLEVLTDYQKMSSLLLAFSQCFEVIWGIESSEKSIKFAKQGMEIIMNNLFKYPKNNSSCFPEILLAANYSGKAVTEAQTSAVNAMSYVLASACEISRGHAAGLCLLHIWKYSIDNIDKYADTITVGKVRNAFNYYRKVLVARNDREAILQLKCILDTFRFSSPKLKDINVIKFLTSSVAINELRNNPIVLDRSAIQEIFESIFNVGSSDEDKNIAAEKELTELRELQELELEILLMVDEVCRKHNITYYLGEGTLLGAIRHAGFIPWDDDVDILMPRRDYDRFIRLAKNKMPAGYNLDCMETNPNHWVIGAKVQITRKTKFVQENVSNLAMYCGPYIDIFPLDYVPKRFGFSQWRQMVEVRFFRRLLFMKTGFSLKMDGKWHRYIMRFFSKFISTKMIHKQINKSMRKFNNKKRKSYMANLGSYYPIVNETFPSYFYGTPSYVKFENSMLPVPSRALDILETIYGKNYMMMPSLRKRKKRHSFMVDDSFDESKVATLEKTKKRESNSPRISVIVPVYNVEEYLEECLVSLVNQTIKDIEILVINDGSPDNSQLIIDKYQKEYPDKIKVFVKENTGLSDTRNFGIRHSNGEYLGFVDSDDYIAFDMYEKMINKAEDTDSDVVVCSINRVSDRSGRKRVQEIKYKNCFGHSLVEKPEIFLGCRPYACNKIYRKKLFTDNLIQYPVGQAFEDSATTYNLLLMANRVELVDEPLYFYRIDRVGSITGVVDDKIYDIFKSCDSIINFYKEKRCFKHLYTQIEEQCRILIFVRINSLRHIDDRTLKVDFVDNAYRYLHRNFKNWRNNPYYMESYKRKSYRKKVFNRIKRNGYQVKLYFAMPDNIRKMAGKLYRRLKGGKRRKQRKKITNYSQDILEKLQQVELGILKTFDKICKDNELTYYLSEGTLLGAVRHKGFIPWDDDIDIVMPRKDYDKLVSIFGDREIDNCLLLNETTFKRYHLMFSKIVIAKPTGFKNTLVDLPVKFSGPYIDIFPLDQGIKSETTKRQMQIRKYRDMLLLKSKCIKPKTLRRRYYNILRYFYSYEGLHKKLRKLALYYNGKKEAQYLVNYASSYPPHKETFPKKAFGAPPRFAQFEGMSVPIPRNPDLVLTTIYNDYMKLPPRSRRKARHSFKYSEYEDRVRD